MKQIMLVVFSLMTACGAPTPPAVSCTADTYPVEGFEARAAEALALRSAFGALNAAMKTAATPGTKVTAAQLEALWAAGEPSLKSTALLGYHSTVGEIFTAYEAASGNTWTPAEPPSGAGGLYSKWVFSQRGVDLQELFAKGAYGAVQFAGAARLMTDAASPADVDTMLAHFGAPPSFPMDDKAMANPDVNMAAYAKRRTNPTASVPGPYLAIKAAFMNARAAVSGGAACAAQRTESFAAIRDQWERAMLGTAVYYLMAAAATLEGSAPSVADQANALHRIGEGVGLLWALREIPSSQRQITDAQLEQILTTLEAKTLAGARLYRFVTDSVSSVAQLSLAVSQIQAARSFSADEINAFKTNF